MAWQMIGKPTTQVADHQLVERFATMTRFGGDRKLNKGRCERLRTLLDEGKFRTCAWATCHCRADGKDYRINGQHTSHVLSEFNGSLPAVFVTVERYEADTLEDVAELFATFDPRWSTRTTADTNNAFAHAIPALAEVNPRAIDLAASGMALYFGGGSRHRVTQEQRGRSIAKNTTFVLWLNGIDICTQATKRFMARSAVAAAMYACHSQDQEAATEFWTAVRNASEPDACHPTRMLERYLIGAKGRTDDREIFAKCVNAWNAWRRGTVTLKVLKWFPESPRPEAI